MRFTKLRALLASILAILMFALPVLAEVPAVGTLTQQLHDQAFASGREVQFEVNLKYEDWKALMSTLSTEEMPPEAEAQVQAMFDLVGTVKVRGSIVQQGENFRVKGAVLIEDQEAFNGTLTYVDKTFYVQSNLIGTKTIAMTFDELLDKMLELGKIWLTDGGMAPAQADAILQIVEQAFRGGEELDAMLASSAEELNAVLAQFAPYLNEVNAWATDGVQVAEESGEFQVMGNIVATKRETVTITADAINALVQRLCDLLAKDETTLAMIAGNMTTDGVTYTTQEVATIVAAVPAQAKVEIAKVMEKPMILTAYMDANGELVGFGMEWTSNGTEIAFLMGNGVSEAGEEVQMHFGVKGADVDMTYDVVMLVEPLVSSDTSNSQKMNYTYALDMTAAGDKVHQAITMDSDITTSETEETQNFNMQMDMNAEGIDMSFGAQAKTQTTKNGDDFLTEMVEQLFFGKDKTPLATVAMTLKSQPADPITAPASEGMYWYLRMTDEEQAALMEEITGDVFLVGLTALSMLPEEIMTMVMGGEQ